MRLILIKPDLPSDKLDPDKEPIAIFMGTTAIVFIICFVLGIFCLDLRTFFRDFKRMRKDVKSFMMKYQLGGYGNKYELPPG